MEKARGYGSMPLPSLVPGTPDVQLDDYRGKFVLLNFWATWSEPCRSDWDALERLFVVMNDDDVVVLGLAVDQGPVDVARDGVAAMDPSIPVVHADASFLSAFGDIRALPTKVLLDQEGRMVGRYEGVVPMKQIRADITAALAR